MVSARPFPAGPTPNARPPKGAFMLLRARSSFFAADRLVRVGDIVDDSDPVVRDRADLFEQVAATSSPLVEKATAVPGEKRPARRKA